MGKKNKQNNNSNKETKNDQDENSKKDEGKQENTDNCKEVVLKVYMHCEGCSNKVSNSLKCVPGVAEVVIDSEDNKVTVKGKKLDAIKVLQRVQRKYSRNSELISPQPKPDAKKTEEKQPEKKKEPQVKTTVLKMFMHCEGCAKDIKKKLEEFTGVVMVEADMEASLVTVKGVFEAAKIVEFISKRMGKHVEIVEQKKEKEDNKSKDDENKNKSNNKKKKDDTNTNANANTNMFHYPPQYATQYVYPCQTFSDENVNACSIM